MAQAAARDSGDSRARSLWWALAALLALQAALAFVPWMGLWGLGIQRFLSPAAAWIPWSLAALACVPAVATRVSPAARLWGETLERRTAAALAIAAAAAALLVWLLPDRVLWVGDSLMRLGGVKLERAPELVSPQALPLDVWLHYDLPRAWVAHHWLDAEGSVRVLGALEAAALGALAGAFALALDTTAAGRAAAMAAVFFGGSLCVMTGESKAFAEMALAVAAVGTLGLRALRGGRWAPALLGLVVASALLAHRLALGLLPALALVAGVLLRRTGRRAGAALACLAPPIIALLFLAGRLWRTLAGYDLPRNFLPAGGGGLGSLLAPTRLLDLASALIVLAPLLPLIPLLWPAAGSRRAGGSSTADPGREAWAFLLVLAAPFLAAALLARPPQGLIRDWDGLVAAGVALCLIAAWQVGGVLRAPRRAALAIPVAAVAAASALAWLLHWHDPARAIARVEALVLEPPMRPPGERARTWEFLAWRAYRRADWDAAAAAFDSSTALGPTPRMLAQWAMAETMRKNYRRARDLYRRAVARDSNYTAAWTGVAVAAIWFEDLEDCEHAARELERLAPRDPKTKKILSYLAHARRAPPAH